MQLREKGYRVFGTVRSPRRASELSAWGVEPVVANVLDPSTLAALPDADRVLFCVGFDRKAGVPMRDVYVDGLRHVLDRLDGRIGRLVYASSTGVYGQADGAWIDETSPTEPVSDSGRVVLDAEELIGERCRTQGLVAVILRFSGLYGPGRILRRASLERGEPIPGDPDHWLNLIEIHDAAACAVAALEHPGPPSSLYLATDDRPVSRFEFYSAVADGLGLPAPRFEPPESGRRESRRDASNKRASNRRIKEELGIRLRYPDVTTGLPAALAGEDG